MHSTRYPSDYQRVYSLENENLLSRADNTPLACERRKQAKYQVLLFFKERTAIVLLYLPNIIQSITLSVSLLHRIRAFL